MFVYGSIYETNDIVVVLYRLIEFRGKAYAPSIY